MFETPYLLTTLVFSSIGMGYFMWGKKQKHKIAFYTGISLMLYPYFITGIPSMIGVGVALMFVPKFVHFD